jgi:hypothetical protein
MALPSASQRKAFEPAPKKIGQVTTVAAACVEHATAPIEPPSQELIEQINVNVAELGAKLTAGIGGVHSR